MRQSYKDEDEMMMNLARKDINFSSCSKNNLGKISLKWIRTYDLCNGSLDNSKSIYLTARVHNHHFSFS